MSDSSDKKYWVGFDLGGTKMLATVFDDNLKPVGQKRRKTKGSEGMKAGLERMIETVRQALDEAKVPPEKVGGIGAGCPGPIEVDRGVVLSMPNLGWTDMPLKKGLEDAFSWPAAVMNDVDAGVYGEYTAGAAKGARCVVGVFAGTGIGGGCVYEGRILRGKTTSCFEIGHCCVTLNGPRCGCGRRGCLEAVAGRLAIAGAAAAAASRGEAPKLLEQTRLDFAEIRSSSLAAAIAAGDKAVEEIVRDAARWLGIGIATAVNLLAPDIVVLGGGLAEAMPELFRDEVSDAARKHVMPSLKNCFNLKLAMLGDDAVVTGAAAWAKNELSSAQKAK